MWEILSTKDGSHIGYAHSLTDARLHVFNGFCFARAMRHDTFLVLDPRDGRVSTLYL